MPQAQQPIPPKFFVDGVDVYIHVGDLRKQMLSLGPQAKAADVAIALGTWAEDRVKPAQPAPDMRRKKKKKKA